GAGSDRERPLYSESRAARPPGCRPGCGRGGNRLGPHDADGAPLRPRPAVRPQPVNLNMETRNVNELCEQQGIDYKQLADRTGLDEPRVLAIVLGRWTPSPAERDRIAAVFGMTRDQISWGHKTPIQHIYGHGPG